MPDRRGTTSADGEAAEPVELSSSPCARADVDPAWHGPAGRTDLLELLNTLLEGERAGARAINEVCMPRASDAVREPLQNVARDEGRFCLMLYRHIVRLGGTPSTATGAFFPKVAALSGFNEQLTLLNHGQAWVVRKLRESLPHIGDPDLVRDLRVMLQVHEQNINHCEAILARTVG